MGSHSIYYKNFPQEFPTTISPKNFPQDFPQDFPARFPTRFSRKISHKISHKIFPQDFPKLDPHWLAPHHPIPNAKFPPITAFLKLAFSPPPFPTTISHKIFPQDFPQDFPTRFSQAGSSLVGSPSPYSKC